MKPTSPSSSPCPPPPREASMPHHGAGAVGTPGWAPTCLPAGLRSAPAAGLPPPRAPACPGARPPARVQDVPRAGPGAPAGRGRGGLFGWKRRQFRGGPSARACVRGRRHGGAGTWGQPGQNPRPRAPCGAGPVPPPHARGHRSGWSFWGDDGSWGAAGGQGSRASRRTRHFSLGWCSWRGPWPRGSGGPAWPRRRRWVVTRARWRWTGRHLAGRPGPAGWARSSGWASAGPPGCLSGSGAAAA